jgi:hypothetical protein
MPAIVIQKPDMLSPFPIDRDDIANHTQGQQNRKRDIKSAGLLE